MLEKKKHLPGTFLEIKFIDIYLGHRIVLSNDLCFDIKTGNIRQRFDVIQHMCGFSEEDVK